MVYITAMDFVNKNTLGALLSTEECLAFPFNDVKNVYWVD